MSYRGKFLKVVKRYWPNVTIVDEILNDDGDNSDSESEDDVGDA